MINYNPEAGTTIPQNRQAEEAVIGSVLIDPVSLYDLQDKIGLGSDDFYLDHNKVIWKAFETLRKANQPIDYLTVCNQLEQSSQLVYVGGDTYLTSLLNQVPTFHNAQAYGQLVVNCSLRRRLIQSCSKVATLAYDENIEISQTLDQLPGLFPELSGTQTHLTTIEEAGLDFMTQLDVPGRQAIPCHTLVKDDVGHDHLIGITDLTNNLGGLPLGYTTLVAGATGTGKTTWGFMQAEIASLLGYKVLYVSTETTGLGMMRKRACGNLGINSKILRMGKADDVAIQAIKDEVNRLIGVHTGKIYFDSKSTNVLGIKSSIAKLCPDLVIIDHLGELAYDGENRTIGIGENFSEIGQYCKHRGGIALVVFHHIDVGVTERPGLNDLRWAKGDLSQKADIVITMFRKDLADARSDNDQLASCIQARKVPVPVEFWIRKDREGPVDVLCKSTYDLHYQTFRSPTLVEQETLFDA